jgi:hypothetical protein
MKPKDLPDRRAFGLLGTNGSRIALFQKARRCWFLMWAEKDS